MTDAREAARRWARTWERCWTALDPEPIVALYGDGCVWRSTSFREPLLGRAGAREYVEGAFADEADIELCSFADPVVDGDRASVEWWCVLQEEGRLATLTGTSVLRFAADGLVVEQRDYWFLEDGRHEPPPEWGR
jgi:hypothetical protein